MNLSFFIKSSVLLKVFIISIESLVLLSKFFIFIKPYVLLSNFIISYKIMCFTKQIYEDKSLSQNHVYIFSFSDFTSFIFLINNLMIFIRTNDFLKQNRTFWGWGNRWAAAGGTLGGHRQYSALSRSIRTL